MSEFQRLSDMADRQKKVSREFTERALPHIPKVQDFLIRYLGCTADQLQLVLLDPDQDLDEGDQLLNPYARLTKKGVEFTLLLNLAAVDHFIPLILTPQAGSRVLVKLGSQTYNSEQFPRLGERVVENCMRAIREMDVHSHITKAVDDAEATLD